MLRRLFRPAAVAVVALSAVVYVAPEPAHATTGKLPLSFSTGTAQQVITVVSAAYTNTTAMLRMWTKTSTGWVQRGSAIRAHIGAQGMTSSPSETKSATPIGSFTLTLAFGHYSNPGTTLPYIHTTWTDWWVSQAGPLYNTHQRCVSCAFIRGSPNEHLYYEMPYYGYAVVIDYNTRNSPTGVVQGKGSAFFLHVTDGTATAGCVAIPQADLVPLLKWLSPAKHPRILMGVVT